jgi:hypothetical protein
MTPRIAIESGWALSGRQLFALGPCRDVAAVDREREQVGERVRGAREGGDAEGSQRRRVRSVVGRCAADGTAALFIGQAGRRLGRTTAYPAFRSLAAACGLELP